MLLLLLVMTMRCDACSSGLVRERDTDTGRPRASHAVRATVAIAHLPDSHHHPTCVIVLHPVSLCSAINVPDVCHVAAWMME